METQYFQIYNSESHEQLGMILATKVAAKKWVKDHITYTHMGEWRKVKGGYEYCTTVGRYYSFINVNRL